MNHLPEWIREKTEPIPEGRYLIGVSGGADSIALLHLFAESPDLSGKTIAAVHVNHGLRGDESDQDEAFVRDICAEMLIPLHVYRIDLNGRHDENAAREARFACFRECMKATGTDTLVLGHHADDLAETFLMRLIRGAGTEGLSCMPPDDTSSGIRIIRPLLSLTRDNIRAALHEAGIPWREDSSNQDPSYLRNNIRMNILPRLEALNPGAASRIARTSRIISADNEALDSFSDQFMQQFSGARWIRWKELSDLPEGLQRRILRKWWRQNTPRRQEHELNAEQTEELTGLVRKGRGQVNLPGGLHAVKGKQAIHLTGIPGNRFQPEPFPEKTTVYGNIRLEITGSAGNPGNGKTEQEVPLSFFSGCMVRILEPGDWIMPFGMIGKKKLPDYLADRGIDLPWREEIPLICRDNEVLIAAGVGTGRIPAWNEACKNIRIRWSGEMPWAL